MTSSSSLITLEQHQYQHPRQGEELKKMIGAVTYIECSSKTQQVPEHVQM
ncbi:hypothetical protein Goari_002051 [Gossypium aridum]|uniref:Uncharacterized protein n=1 Tax=Gossypium aridum TaxID=34290 RepID=A0A7J8Y8P5_GOSAI|nr:hypothetical protein [Gossypium aridum]